jgi:hypothetical protein
MVGPAGTLTPFAYFDDLSPEQKVTYLQSDSVRSIRVPRYRELWPEVSKLKDALAADDRQKVEEVSQRICHGITLALEVEPAVVEVLALRPYLEGGSELHGLYTAEEDEAPRIQVWMRTARHGRVVAFRTFLRTLLHEVCHHLDFAYLDLGASFHTQGFFRRESSLFHQLVAQGS